LGWGLAGEANSAPRVDRGALAGSLSRRRAAGALNTRAQRAGQNAGPYQGDCEPKLHGVGLRLKADAKLNAIPLANGADEDEHKADDERYRDDRADRMKPNLAPSLAVHRGPFPRPPVEKRPQPRGV
jgi:hypothetical protein